MHQPDKSNSLKVDLHQVHKSTSVKGNFRKLRINFLIGNLCSHRTIFGTKFKIPEPETRWGFSPGTRSKSRGQAPETPPLGERERQLAPLVFRHSCTLTLGYIGGGDQVDDTTPVNSAERQVLADESTFLYGNFCAPRAILGAHIETPGRRPGWDSIYLEQF